MQPFSQFGDANASGFSLFADSRCACWLSVELPSRSDSSFFATQPRRRRDSARGSGAAAAGRQRETSCGASRRLPRSSLRRCPFHRATDSDSCDGQCERTAPWGGQRTGRTPSICPSWARHPPRPCRGPVSEAKATSASLRFSFSIDAAARNWTATASPSLAAVCLTCQEPFASTGAATATDDLTRQIGTTASPRGLPPSQRNGYDAEPWVVRGMWGSWQGGSGCKRGGDKTARSGICEREAERASQAARDEATTQRSRRREEPKRLSEQGKQRPTTNSGRHRSAEKRPNGGARRRFFWRRLRKQGLPGNEGLCVSVEQRATPKCKGFLPRVDGKVSGADEKRSAQSLVRYTHQGQQRWSYETPRELFCGFKGES